MSYFADIAAGAIQYGGRTEFCANLQPYVGQSGDKIAQAIIDSSDDTPDGYDRNIIASTTVDPNSAGRPWNFQVCTEYGWFQTPSESNPMRSQRLKVPYWLDYCNEVFQGLDMTDRPQAKQTEISQGGYDTAGTNIFFGNGSEDPWRWVTLQYPNPQLGIVTVVSECNDCGHCAELYTPSDKDPDTLRETRVVVARWIDELLNGKIPSEEATTSSTITDEEIDGYFNLVKEMEVRTSVHFKQ